MPSASATLQVRVAGYQALEADAATLRQVLALCTGTPDYAEVAERGQAPHRIRADVPANDTSAR